MGQDVMSYGGLSLRGEKVSIGSPPPAALSRSVRTAAAAGRDFIQTAIPVMARAASRLWPAVALCGVVALSIAPALLLFRYPLDELTNALAHVALKPTLGQLLTLSMAVAYAVLTGLMLGTVTGIPRRKAWRMLLRLAVAPLVTLSLVATFVAAVPLFFGAVIMCFPGLV